MDPGPGLTIRTAELGDGTVGVAYGFALEATGGNGSYAWSIATGSLPDGLSLDDDLISGTPAQAGYFPLGIQVASGGSTASADHRMRVYPTQALRLFLYDLPVWITSSIEYNQDLLPQNPTRATEIEAKVELLSEPDLEASILNESLFEADETVALDGRIVPLAVVFPADTMRTGAQQDFSRLSAAVTTLEEFIGVPWPWSHVHEFYGFRLGHSGGGGDLFMEDRGTYADRGVPQDVIVTHELGHSYIGHEGLNQFLEVYAYNVVDTGSTDLAVWTWTRSIGGVPYVPFAEDNDGVWALMDMYQLMGVEAMGRAYARVHAMGAPYGVPLAEAARQAFVEEAPEAVRDQVTVLILRV